MGEETIEHIDDNELVSKIVKNNNTHLYAVLYDRHATIIYNKCLSFVKTKEEAQDLTHDIFVLLFAKLKTFKGTSKFSTWLYSFTYNFCVNYVQRKLKKKKEKILVTDRVIEFAGEEIPDEDILKLKKEKLSKALNKIEVNDKIILMMKYQDDLLIKEIKEILKISSDSAVKMRLNRAKSRLITIYNDI
ncbi:RNA polymerase subunit sigma-70 [Flavobacteriaceae bacterium (ex Bugula neritina AB1)]|nr:RNA polymerase subunit sigma-70 [Flavobacteriaceae bacterium (ex Bugula neritina AB1)]